MEPERFAFGDNWRRYLETIDDVAIAQAMADLRDWFGDDLRGRSLIDVGSGSGLHSLAAHRLGVARLHSFDYDADSVACTRTLREREGNPPSWTVERGSVLDAAYLATLGTFDVVYSWGVLHHTGRMWTAIENAAALTHDRLLIGIYNRKPVLSPAITAIKRRYVRSGPVGRAAIKWSYFGVVAGARMLKKRDLVSHIRNYRSYRGMNYWRDLEDWVGGYPFECATAEEVERFVTPLGFTLETKRTGSSYEAVNVFLFRRAR